MDSDLQYTDFIPLSKDRTRELEEITQPFVMALSHCSFTPEHSDLVVRFHSWHIATNEDIHASLYKKVQRISEKLGLKQTYYVTYWERNAVWGLEYNGCEFLLYYSNKGMSLQVMSDISCSALRNLLNAIIDCWGR